MKFQLVLLAVLLSYVSLGVAACCRPQLSKDGHPVCDDLTRATPCCGNGKCDGVCCKCKGGCRKAPPHSVMEDALFAGHAHHTTMEPEDDFATCHASFLDADANGDGQLSFLEWVRSAIVQETDSIMMLVSHWEKLDVEGKWYITEEEALTRFA